MGGPGLPSSPEDMLRFLVEFSYNYLVEQPKCKYQGKCEYNDQDGLESEWENIHGGGSLSGKMD